MSRRFDGAAVVVTGGSSGIGLATAKAFAAEGADVGIVARDPGRLARAADEVRAVARTGRKVEAFSADVSVAGRAEEAIGHMTEAGIAPDILVNSAGIIHPGRFEEMDAEVFEFSMRSGYFSAVHPTRAAVRGMVERGRGHIVNVSSVAGFLGIYGYTAYSPVKYAVIGFSEALRFEMKPHGIHVSVVCPPDTDTPGLAYEKRLRPPETDRVAGNIRPVSAERVARAILGGVSKRQHMIIPDFQSRSYRLLKALVPGLFFMIVDGDVAKARREAAETLGEA